MSKRWRLLIVLVSLVILVLLFWGPPSDNLQYLTTENSPQNRSPATYITGAEITQYSDNGNIAYILESKEIIYFELKNDAGVKMTQEVTLELPLFKIYREQTGAQLILWELSSFHAKGSEQQDHWLMTGEVTLTHRAPSGDLSTLVTDELLFKPRERYAETHKSVTITTQSSITTATGLKLFFDDERIELLSDVTSQYRSYGL